MKDNEMHEQIITKGIRASRERLTHILEAVAISVGERMVPLRQVEKFKNVGIEAWFKVEVFHALRNIDPVLRPQNKGPDLVLSDKLEIELKGATDFNIKGWFIPGLKYGTPCLFLGWTDTAEKHLLELKNSFVFETIGVHRLRKSGWYVGIIVPIDYLS